MCLPSDSESSSRRFLELGPQNLRAPSGETRLPRSTDPFSQSGVFLASSPTASLQDHNYCLYFFHRWLFPMVIVRLTRKEIISNSIPVRKVEKKKRLTHLGPA